MVNSMFCDCRWRQLSTSVWYRSFGKRSKLFRCQLLAAVRSVKLLADERIVWLRSLIKYLRLLNIGSYSRAFNFSGNKKRNHSNGTSCAARHENEKSFIGGKFG